MKPLVVLLLLSAAAMAADLHPIVETDTGYLFGGSANGKWVKAEQAAKSMKGRTAFRVFGLTQEVGKPRQANRNLPTRRCVRTC